MRPSNSCLRATCARCVRISSCPGSSAGMRLAGEQEQHLARAVGEQAAQAVEVVEQQRRALVGGEAPPEADGEHVRVRRDRRTCSRRSQVRLAAVVARVLRAHAMAHHVQHARLEVLAHAPEDVVGNGADLLPDARMAEAVHPAHAEEAVEHLAPFGREEGRHVHAVGDVAERVLLGRDLRPVVAAACAPRRRRGCARRRSGSASRGWRARSC